MLPCFITRHAPHLGFRNPILGSQYSLSLACRQPQSDLYNLLLGQLRIGVARSAAGRSMNIPVGRVVFRRSPSQIVGAIVSPIAVSMGRVKPWSRLRTMESLADQHGYLDTSVVRFSTSEQDIIVTVYSHLRSEYKPSWQADIWNAVSPAARPAWRGASQSTKVTDLIVRIAFHQTPFFCRELVSHIARLIRAVGQGWRLAYDGPLTPSLYQHRHEAAI